MHALWVAYQMAQFDVVASTWPNNIRSLGHELLMNDVWIRLIMALMFIIN
jgi:hypothetical protein